MKKINSLVLAILLLLASMVIITGCSKYTNHNSNISKTITNDNRKNKTTKFFANGDYIVGEDIQPGNYYMVLTKIRYGSGSDANEAYVYYSDSKNKTETLQTLGKAYRVSLKKGDTITFNDNYSPKDWEVTFYTPKGYLKNRKKLQKLQTSKSKNNNSNSTKTTSLQTESTTTKATNPQTSPSTSNDKKIYSDSYIIVTKKGGTLHIKNISGQDIVLSGTAYLDNSIEINMYDFGYIGEIKSGGTVTQSISNLTLMDQGKDGDTEDGETLGGNKTYNHKTKSNEIISWSGEIQDSNYNTLAQISFDFRY